MNKTNIYFTGDIHGEFNAFGYYIIKQKQLKDCSVIVCGDIGMGFYKVNYYIDTFKTLNKKLNEVNVHVYFLRGNHDNPIYFTDNTPINIEYSNIHFIKDYEILHINDLNILCVGGATSIDRIYRKEGESWWKDESVIYKDIDNFDIDIIATHCAPMFVLPKYERISWMSDLDDERAQNDRKLFSDLYIKLCKNNPNKVKFWFYGHYHNHFETYVPNIILSDYDESLLRQDTINENDFNTGCKFVGLDMIEGKTTKIDLYNYDN